MQLLQFLTQTLSLAGVILAACENPASFKKCVEQTRAEVNICGINMTCKCARQEYVVRCYEKCGDDEHYQKMMEGEKGQQQIFCSQTKPGEPEDLPIIGSEGGSSSKGKDKKDGKQAKPAEKPKPTPKPQAPPPPQNKQRESHEDDAPVMGARGKHNGIYEDLGAGNNLIHGGSLGSNEGSAKEMAGGNGLVMGGVDSGAAASATLCAGSFVVLAAIFGTLV